MRLLVLIGLLGGLSAFELSAANPTNIHHDTQAANLTSPGANGWEYMKVDPKTKTKLVVIHAKSWARTNNPYVIRLDGVTGSVYNLSNSSYSDITFNAALLDERSGILISGRDLKITTIP